MPKYLSNFGAQIALLIALISLSLTAIFIKISLQEISADATLFNRLWLATLLFGMWSGVKQFHSQKENTESAYSGKAQVWDIGLLVAVGIAHVLGRLCWTWSLTQTSVANANVLGALTPLFTTLGGWLLFKQYFDRRFLIGLLFAILGATTLGLEDLFKSTNTFTGDGLALVSSLFYAANFLIIEKLGKRFSVTTILLWRCTIGTLIMLPIVLIFEQQIFPISVGGWIIIFCLAAICEFLGHGMVVYSLKYFSSGFVSIFLLLDPVIAAIIAWILFSENLSLVNILGFAVILEGIYLAKTGQGSEKELKDSAV